MNLTPTEAYVLLGIYLDKDIVRTEIETEIDSLTNQGLIYSNSEKMQITRKGKHRINNHITKERSLPDYITKYSFGEAFDKFFSTATSNAVNALCISMLNSNKVIGLHPVTLNRLRDAVDEDIARKQMKSNFVIKYDAHKEG